MPLPNDWSLYDAESGFEIARINQRPNGLWDFVVRAVRDNELQDVIAGGNKTGPEAKQYCEAQTGGCRYLIERKRTKAEILRHAGVR